MSLLAAWKALWSKASEDEKQDPARVAQVGWVLDAEKGGVLWGAPKRLERQTSDVAHAKSLQFCPAMIDFDARHFEIPCPFDLEVRFGKDPKTGAPILVNTLGDKSPIRAQHLGKMLHIVPQKEWRHPQRPVLQIGTPYLFIADEPIYVNQIAPFNHYRDPQWPGLLVGGRFPIDAWPRHLMWAFEWHDLSKPLVLRRGEPWFYARFETLDPSRPVKLVEAEITPELRAFIDQVSGVTNYVNRTFSLFETARERRPKVLLKPKER